MSKSLISLLFMVVLTGSAFADNNTKCLEEHPQKRTVYRDEAGVVTCVNYGGKRAVEYSYNKFKTSRWENKNTQKEL
jgi:hypothetical protein